MTPHTALMKLMIVSQAGLPFEDPLEKPSIMAFDAIMIMMAIISHSYHLSSLNPTFGIGMSDINVYKVRVFE